MPTLKPPSERTGVFGTTGLWRFYTFPQGKTLIKGADGVWYVEQYPAQIELRDSQMFFLGGHTHDISDAVADELTDAGYGDYISHEGS